MKLDLRHVVSLRSVDGDTFRFGPTIRGKLDERGQFVVLTWRERLWKDLAECLWPARNGQVRVTHIDRDAGVITVGDAP